MIKIDALQIEYDCKISNLESQQIVDDFFYINKESLSTTAGIWHCWWDIVKVNAGQTIDFEGKVDQTYGNAIRLKLLMDGTEVAHSVSNTFYDNDEDGPLAVLFYRNLVKEDAKFEFCLFEYEGDPIEEMHLQYGYKIYGPGHNWHSANRANCP